MTSTSLESSVLDDAALATLFLDARTHFAFDSTPIPAETLQKLYDLVKLGPTAANSQPLRIVFLTSDEAKARLIPFLGEANKPKAQSAGAVALLAADADFNEHQPEVFPHAPESKDWFGDLENRTRVAGLNAGLQAGYFILAARALGLATGPFNGMDAVGVDGEFFAGTNTHVLLAVNLGLAAEPAPFDRLPRRKFEDVVTTL